MRTLAAAAVLAATFALPALAQQQEQPQPQGPQQQQAQMSAEADSLIGKKAMNAQGKELGSIEDVLVGQDGRVQAVVMEHDGAKRAVPWSQMSLQGDQVTVKLSEQQMSQLPEYNAEKE